MKLILRTTLAFPSYLVDVEILLKADKAIAHVGQRAERSRCVVNCVILQLEQATELVLTEFFHALLDILRQDEVEERRQLAVVACRDLRSMIIDPL